MQLLLSCLILIFAGCSQEDSQKRLRTVEDTEIRSQAHPAICLEVDLAFRCLGVVPFRVREIAAGERFVLVDANQGRVHRMVVAQFETTRADAAVTIHPLNTTTPMPEIIGMNGVCQDDRVKGWSGDIDYLLAKAKEQHYVYKNRDLPPAMVRAAEELKTRIPEYSDERMLVELQALIYHLGDGHSYLLPLLASITESKSLPLHLYEFTDGMYVIDADESNTRLIGMKVKTIAGTTPETIMRDMVTFVSQDNTVGAQWIGPTFMRQRGLLERYRLPKGSPAALIRFENPSGTEFEETIPFVVLKNFRGVPKMVPPKNTPADKIPLYLSNIEDNFWFKHLPESNAVYFQWNQVRNKEGETIAAFSARLENELKMLKPSLLIVDVRHNNGGDGSLTTAVVKMLTNFEETQKGKLVIITGRNTFSAAQIFLGRADLATNAIFAGEPSSSKPNFVGEENEVVLPYSGARGSISNRYHEQIPGDTREWIEPELKVRLSSKDYFGNYDPVLEAVLTKYGKGSTIASAPCFSAQDVTSSDEVEMFAPETISVGNVYRGTFTPDGNEFYFFKKIEEGTERYRIFRSTLSIGRWSTPEPVDLGGDFSDLYPAISPDGKQMIFSSYRPAPNDDSEHASAYLWSVDREGEGWGKPIFLNTLNRFGHYHSQPIFNQSRELHFIRSTWNYRDSQEWTCRWTDAQFAEPVLDPVWLHFSRRVPTGWRLWETTPGFDGSYVLLVMARINANNETGPADFWIAFREGENWTDARPLDSSISSDRSENFGFFSPGGREFFFVRDLSQFYRAPTEALFGHK